MPGRDPEAQKRSELVAQEIRRLMVQRGMTGKELRDALRAAGVAVPNGMWLTRRLAGNVNLVEPTRVVYGPTDDLVAIAAALDTDPDRLIHVISADANTA